MRNDHTPSIDARYWTAISIASVFGANLGDFASHILHLGHWRGLAPLAVLAAGVFVLERRSKVATELFYWLLILLVRTAATNLADLLTHEFKLGYAAVIAVLAALLAGVVALNASKAKGPGGLPAVDGQYWAAMLIAGTLGTAAGDGIAGQLGLGVALASVLLAAVTGVAFYLRARPGFQVLAFYWATIVLVRTTGTTIGDLAAHSGGLVVSTVATGCVFAAVLAFWRPRPGAVLATGAVEAKA